MRKNYHLLLNKNGVKTELFVSNDLLHITLVKIVCILDIYVKQRFVCCGNLKKGRQISVNDNPTITKTAQDTSSDVYSRTLNDVIYETTVSYLKSLDKTNPPSPRTVEHELLTEINDVIALENMCIPTIPMRDVDGNPIFDKYGNPKTIPLRKPWKNIDRLLPQQLAEIIMFFHNIVRIDTAETNVESEEDLLAVYCADGPNEGIYDINESTLYRIIKAYDYQLEKAKFEEVCFTLQSLAPRKMRCRNRDYIAVNNGIFNYATKTLMPFDPNLVYLAKSRVNYNPNAAPVIIKNPDGTDWDVDTWLSELSDDPEIINLIWQMLSAIIRPFVRWNKSIWLYSTTGNNGKGTLCELMRNLCGAGTYTSISLSDFSKEFALQPLLHCNAIIVDENDVGSYLDKLANLKAVVTNDIVQINRKFENAISFRFWGFMVQCINDLPRIRDKSDSFYRRQILVPMEKCFTGIERRYIKDDYLSRNEVLEYVLKKVLHTDFYELSVPQRCQNLLGVYKEINDPVREFISEFKERFAWDLIPTEFLYDLYKSWYSRCNPSGKPEGKTNFKKQLDTILLEPDFSPYWKVAENAVSVGNKMSCPEPLISIYDLTNWKNPSYNGSDINKISMPRLLSTRYRGIVRQLNAPAANMALPMTPDQPTKSS